MNYGRSPMMQVLPLIRELDEVLESIRAHSMRMKMDKPESLTSLPLTKNQARQVRAFIKREEAKMNKEQQAEPMTATEALKRRAELNKRAAHLFAYYLDQCFNQGENQMQALQVRGTDEYREPTEDDVVWKDQIIGSDPDPQVRASLLKEAQAGDGDSG